MVQIESISIILEHSIGQRSTREWAGSGGMFLTQNSDGHGSLRGRSIGRIKLQSRKDHFSMIIKEIHIMDSH